MHQRLCSDWRQAGSDVRVVLVHVRARVLWAPGFSRADVSNQSLSRSSFIPLSRCWWSCGEMGMAPPPPPPPHPPSPPLLWGRVVVPIDEAGGA